MRRVITEEVNRIVGTKCTDFLNGFDSKSVVRWNEEEDAFTLKFLVSGTTDEYTEEEIIPCDDVISTAFRAGFTLYIHDLLVPLETLAFEELEQVDLVIDFLESVAALHPDVRDTINSTLRAM